MVIDFFCAENAITALRITRFRERFGYRQTIMNNKKTLVGMGRVFGLLHGMRKGETRMERGTLQALRNPEPKREGSVSYTHLDVYKRQPKERACLTTSERVV